MLAAILSVKVIPHRCDPTTLRCVRKQKSRRPRSAAFSKYAESLFLCVDSDAESLLVDATRYFTSSETIFRAARDLRVVWSFGSARVERSVFPNASAKWKEEHFAFTLAFEVSDDLSVRANCE